MAPALHYVWLGSGQLTALNYLSVLSAVAYHRDSPIYWHCDEVPKGYWGERIRELVTPRPVKVPTHINDRQIMHPAHASDVLRLEILHEQGGVYLDTDVVCVRTLAELYDEHSCVLGTEGDRTQNGIGGLGNAVIVSKPGSEFIDAWIKGFTAASSLTQGFRSEGKDRYWAEMSIQYPALLADALPHAVTVLPPTAFYEPMWFDLDVQRFLESDVDLADDAYVRHLWQSHPRVSALMKDSTLLDLLSLESALGNLVRKAVRDAEPAVAHRLDHRKAST